jgi:uncharacterized membrane protein
MSWFFIALIGPLLWSLVNHADKYLLSKYTKESEGGVGSLMIFSTLFSVFLLPVIFYFDQTIFSVSNFNIFILLLVGILNALSILLYMYALEDEETSIVVPLFQLIPVFGYFLGYLFLGEVLEGQKIFAASIIILGGMVLSLEFNEEQKISFKRKALVLMVSSTFLIAFSEVLFKFVVIEEGSFWSSVFWNYSGLVIVGIILFTCVKSYRLEFLKLLRTSGKTILSINVSSEIITVVGNIVFGYATLLAPIALVMTVNAYQPVIVFLLGIILTIYAPHISVEKIGLRHLLHKGIAIGIMVFASYLLY